MCSNFWPCTDHPTDHGLNGHCLKGLCPGDRRPPTRYISRLWAARTIQEDTRNWKDQKTYPVDCRATSPTTQERDSLKSQGRGWPRGPTWRLGISAGNAKLTSRSCRPESIQSDEDSCRRKATTADLATGKAAPLSTDLSKGISSFNGTVCQPQSINGSSPGPISLLKGELASSIYLSMVVYAALLYCSSIVNRRGDALPSNAAAAFFLT
ncbi:hypothetical protein KSP39_PZI014403 [Platanthera zijinensis]|uniref:Uncharacterized protein n=1 Tax=Platanthera zijinensis TaxID=2320716 RepID=A0AAP0BA88_9ASPA